MWKTIHDLAQRFSVFILLPKFLNASTEPKSSGVTSHLIYPTWRHGTHTLPLSSTSMSLEITLGLYSSHAGRYLDLGVSSERDGVWGGPNQVSCLGAQFFWIPQNSVSIKRPSQPVELFINTALGFLDYEFHRGITPHTSTPHPSLVLH